MKLRTRLPGFKRRILVVAGALLSIGGTADARTADVLAGRDGWLYPGWTRPVGDRPADTQQAVDLVAKVREDLTRRGIRLVVVLIPAKPRVEPQHLIANPPDAGAYNGLVRNLRGRGVTVLDTLQILQARDRLTADAFPARDAHWTAMSAEDVAHSLASQLRPTVKPRDRAEIQGAWTLVKRDADLVEIQKREHVAATFGPDIFRLRNYTNPSAGQPALVVVGNSFADRQYGLPQALGAQLRVPVRHIIRYGDDGAWEAMSLFLLSPSTPSARTVVWAMTEGCFSSAASQRAMVAYFANRRPGTPGR